MKIRPHRGGLAESMSEQVEIEPTREAIARFFGISPESMSVKFYAHDKRINQDCYIVTADGVYGFTDSMPVR